MSEKEANCSHTPPHITKRLNVSMDAWPHTCTLAAQAISEEKDPKKRFEMIVDWSQQLQSLTYQLGCIFDHHQEDVSWPDGRPGGNQELGRLRWEAEAAQSELLREKKLSYVLFGEMHDSEVVVAEVLRTLSIESQLLDRHERALKHLDPAKTAVVEPHEALAVLSEPIRCHICREPEPCKKHARAQMSGLAVRKATETDPEKTP